MAAAEALEKSDISLMKILSPFRDFYDFVSHVHGRDEKHTYVRRAFEGAPNPYFLNRHPTFVTTVEGTSAGLGLIDIYSPYRKYSWVSRSLDYREVDEEGRPLDKKTKKDFASRLSQYDTYWIAVAGKVYAVIGRKGMTEEERERQVGETRERKRRVEDDPKSYTLLHEGHAAWPLMSNAARARFSTPIDGGETLLAIHRKLQAPVFSIFGPAQTTKQTEVSYHIGYYLPVLQEHDFQSVVDPYQLYQDLEYFIANTMNESPDTMPATQMTDKEKIVAAGFDLKQSFRHRKG